MNQRVRMVSPSNHRLAIAPIIQEGMPSSNFMKAEYLDMAVRMASAGSQPLRSTIRHSRQFLRGVTDFDNNGNYAWKKGEYAKNCYEFSENAWPHRELKNYNKVLHGEHIIPLKMVFDRWLELIDAGYSPEKQRSFLERHLIVVWITIAEQQRIDRELGLRTKMPEGWGWGDDTHARLRVAGIKPMTRM